MLTQREQLENLADRYIPHMRQFFELLRGATFPDDPDPMGARKANPKVLERALDNAIGLLIHDRPEEGMTGEALEKSRAELRLALLDRRGRN